MILSALRIPASSGFELGVDLAAAALGGATAYHYFGPHRKMGDKELIEAKAKVAATEVELKAKQTVVNEKEIALNEREKTLKYTQDEVNAKSIRLDNQIQENKNLLAEQTSKMEKLTAALRTQFPDLKIAA